MPATIEKNSSVISHDGSIRGTVTNVGTKQTTVETAEGKKRVGNGKLSIWFKGPHPTPVKVSVRKARRANAKQARKVNR